jgi:hypothetical protein
LPRLNWSLVWHQSGPNVTGLSMVLIIACHCFRILWRNML